MIANQQLSSQGNNFLAVRLLLSFGVIVSHAFVLNIGREGSDPFEPFLGGMSLGYHAVNAFFFLSGFLVAGSFNRTPNAVGFAVARASRILPGLAVNLVLTTAILGLLASSFSPAVYFSMAESWTWVPRNLVPISMQWSLPGVFSDNPYSNTVNGSLWTIRYELLCYMGLGLAGVLGLFSHARLFVISLAVFTVVQAVWWTIGGQALRQYEFADSISDLLRLSLSFVLGVAAFQYRNRIVVRWRYLAAGLVMAALYFTIGVRASFFDQLGVALIAGYLVLCLGFRTPTGSQQFLKDTDISFGLYIYAFPVQQMLFHLFPPMGPIMNILLTGLIAGIISFVSWLLVERPALDIGKRFVRSKSIVAAPA